MNETELSIRQKLKDDFRHYAERCLKIRTKPGEIAPFKLNTAQLYIHEQAELQKIKTGKVRAIILKGRQQGCSTYIEGRFYWQVTHRFGVRAFILTHHNEATNNLFEMAKRYHEHCPDPVKPSIQASNAKELIFGKLDSGYKLGTAGNKFVGRSSTIQYLHGSEVAFWTDASEHAKGILQAVPNQPGTEVFIESTAYGVGNYFHEQWQQAESGLSDFIAIFIPWFWQEEYREIPKEELQLDPEEEELTYLYNLSLEQIAWRRLKIQEFSGNGMDGRKAFQQEYPNNPIEAFQASTDDTFIPSDIVSHARQQKCDPYGPLVIGVDPARYGDDRTSIIRRKGRVAYDLQSFIKKDGMEVVGLVHTIIQKEKPFKVCFDVCGLGGPMYDRLCELGHKDIIIPVNASHKPWDDERYKNKRAEMWGMMKDWLLQGTVQIPDSNSLHADLCGIKYKPESQGRILLEDKEHMKKRGIRSPDEADALALTFCVPESAYILANSTKSNELAKDLYSGYNKINSLRKRAYGRK